jgi:hypothetical protein
VAAFEFLIPPVVTELVTGALLRPPPGLAVGSRCKVRIGFELAFAPYDPRQEGGFALQPLGLPLLFLRRFSSVQIKQIFGGILVLRGSGLDPDDIFSFRVADLHRLKVFF